MAERWRVLVLAAFGLIAATVPAVAQPAVEWPPRLKAEQAVWVVLDGPTVLEGRVIEVKAEGMRVQQAGERRWIYADDIHRIEVRDSLRNGTVIGGAAGAGALGGWYALLASNPCTDCNGDRVKREILTGLQWAAIGGAIGAVIGRSVDALRHGRRTIYVAPTFRMPSPTGAARAGGQVTIHW